MYTHMQVYRRDVSGESENRKKSRSIYGFITGPSATVASSPVVEKRARWRSFPCIDHGSNIEYMHPCFLFITHSSPPRAILELSPWSQGINRSYSYTCFGAVISHWVSSPSPREISSNLNFAISRQLASNGGNVILYEQITPVGIRVHQIHPKRQSENQFDHRGDTEYAQDIEIFVCV